MGASDPVAVSLSEGTPLAILNALPLAVVVVDREERVVYANPLAERLLADRLELGRAVPWWGPDSRLAAPACAVNGLVGGFEWGAVHANAAVVPSATGGMLRPMRIALDGGEGLTLVALTAVSRTDESHLGRDPAEHLREVQAIARLGSWSWDIDADVMSWSDESFRLFGLAPQAVPGNYEEIRQRMHPENRVQSEEVIERCRESGEGFAYTRRVVADGSVRWHQGRAQPVIADGRVVR